MRSQALKITILKTIDVIVLFIANSVILYRFPMIPLCPMMEKIFKRLFKVIQQASATWLKCAHTASNVMKNSFYMFLLCYRACWIICIGVSRLLSLFSPIVFTFDASSVVTSTCGPTKTPRGFIYTVVLWMVRMWFVAPNHREILNQIQVGSKASNKTNNSSLILADKIIIRSRISRVNRSSETTSQKIIREISRWYIIGNFRKEYSVWMEHRFREYYNVYNVGKTMPSTTHLGMVARPPTNMVIWAVVYGIVYPHYPHFGWWNHYQSVQ